MFLSVKRKTILVGLLVVMIAVGLCFMVSATATSAYSVNKNGKVIVIDAGHGGADGGVVGVTTGIKESDINLAIARNLKHFLKTAGYEVILTRSTTDGLYGMTTKNKKQKDMEARKKIINGANADLMVSIHCNSYPRADQTGTQVFFAPNSEQGKLNATLMQSIINKALGGSRTAMKGDYFILQCSSTPSLLVECGFLTSPVEEKLLISAAYQEQVAYNIYAAIQALLSSPNKVA